MPRKRSAGILLFRRVDGDVEVLLGHMGGPLWARRDAGAWSLPKGEYETGEEPIEAARREFEEELGLPPPTGILIDLGEAKQSSGKIVTAWAIEADLDLAAVVPGMFEMEWPPGSGVRQRYPEIDRVAWLGLGDATTKIVAGQRVLLDRLMELLRG